MSALPQVKRRYIKRGPPAPSVSLTRQRLFTFNLATHLQMGQPEAVIFSYDKDNQLIKIEPSERGVQGAYTVSKAHINTTSCKVSAWAFCGYFGINIETSLRFTPEFEGQSLIVDLAQGQPTGKNQRHESEPR
jgi:hypothetical protein